MPRNLQSGFTVIEGLVATAILLLVAIGIIPLFASAILNNSQGSDLTATANYSKSQEEFALNLPFDNPTVVLTAGAQVQSQEWWRPNLGMINDSNEGWQAGTPAAIGDSRWTRTTTVQQFGLEDILTNGSPTMPLDASTQQIAVQIKRITVDVQSSKQGGILGGGKRISLQYLKGY